MNWKIFDLKYENREQWAFEKLSYLLFCSHFGNKTGLFRYKNQTGIETEPIEKDGKYYGFQAKYYTSAISESDITDSIKKAKLNNPKLEIIYLYTNKELSESSKKGKKKPKYQIAVEEAAKNINISIQWQVPSHFEVQLALPENKYIHDLFFILEPSGLDLIDEMFKHNENILQTVQTEIIHENTALKIDRKPKLHQLAQLLEDTDNVIIYGEGGCGKTALLKEFYNSYAAAFPICIFKASELNVASVNDLLKFGGSFTSDSFFETFEKEDKKIFVIDSAEKLAELTNSEVLNNLIQALNSNGWKIIFTTRYSYLTDLSFHIKENYQLTCSNIDIPLITTDELIQLSAKGNFTLPANEKFSERLTNLFYLNEYIKYYQKINKDGNFRNFVDLIWKKKIQDSSIQKDNLHLQRDKCLTAVATKRCESGLFYIAAESLPQQALFHLKQDEILGYDEIHNGYFITHDIYEEWALDKIISRSYANHLCEKQFFEQLGESLPIRRAFRLWLSEQLLEASPEIESFVQNTFTSSDISQFWKDEMLVAVLLSSHSEYFFTIFENKIIAEDFKTFKRILFLLRIACTEIAASEDLYAAKPKGTGWQTVIRFIDKYKNEFFENNLPLILPILTDWTTFNATGETTRFSGLLALSIFEKTEADDKFFMDDKAEEKILKVVFNSSDEIHPELNNIFDKVIANQWNTHSSPYEGLCSNILNKPYLALKLIGKLPLSVIRLCGLFWRKKKIKKNRFAYDDDYQIESKYGLADEHRFNYSPASAYQTPVYWLLQSDLHATIDFIVEFTNNAVEAYRFSDYGQQDVHQITLQLQEEEVNQNFCWALWGAYRGIGSPVVPYLLQSVHMALEKVLLEVSEIADPAKVEKILIKLLHSKSASITSVVCSVVLAYRDKFYNVARILFKTLELFQMDSSRWLNENHALTLYSIGYGLDTDKFYNDERISTCSQSHRKLDLERLFLHYQYSGVKGFSEEQNTAFISDLYNIIEAHKKNLRQNLPDETHPLHILLARMDRRNLAPKIISQDKNSAVVQLTPSNLSKKQILQSELALKNANDTLKYSYLRTWSNFISNGEKENNPKLTQYDQDPLLALAETRQLVEELEQGRQVLGIFEYSLPGFACAKLLIEHKEILAPEDVEFCREIILSNVARLFSDGYDFQISDGVEASINAIPALLKIYPQDYDRLVSILVVCLLDRTPIGYYKRICDYAIEAINKSKMWQTDPIICQQILLGYCTLRPTYEKIYKAERTRTNFGESTSRKNILVELENQFSDLDFKTLSFDQINVDDLNIYDLEIIYLLIPSDSKDQNLLALYQKTLPRAATDLLQDRHSYRREHNQKDIYKERINIFKRFSYFILHREKDEIDIYLKPFIDSFQATEEAVSFLEQLIFAQDRINHYKQFWQIWKALYQIFIDLSKNSRSYRLNELTWTYMLAWQNWKSTSKDWHSLKKENMTFYKDIAQEIGYQPAVLYSLAKVLNSIGSGFSKEGVELIHTVIAGNKNLKLEKLQSNTEYYLENFMRKFIFVNKKQIKSDARLKNKVIQILDFMLERGSKHGYLMRESIL